MNLKEIKYINPQWSKRSGHKIVDKPSIRFVRADTEYDNPDKTNVSFVYLNLDSSTTAAKKSGDEEEGDK